MAGPYKARRKRATVQRGASTKTSRFKAAGILAHNRRLGSAVNSRSIGSKSRSMGLAEARMTRLRRKVRAVNPRLAARRAAGRSVESYARERHGSGFFMKADATKVARRPARIYKRDSRGRFARR